MNNPEQTVITTAVPQATPVGRNRLVQTLLQYGIVLVLIALVVTLSILSPTFRTTDNLIQVLLQASINTIIALGITFVIITAGIDLSVGSTAAMAGLVAAKLLVGGMAWPLAVVAALVVGLFIGFINGFLIT